MQPISSVKPAWLPPGHRALSHLPQFEPVPFPYAFSPSLLFMPKRSDRHLLSSPPLCSVNAPSPRQSHTPEDPSRHTKYRKGPARISSLLLPACYGRGTAVPLHAAAVCIGGYAYDGPESPGKFAGIIISEFPRNIQHRPIRFPQELRRPMHLLRPQKGCRGHAVYPPKALLQSRSGNAEPGCQRFGGAFAIPVGQQISFHLLGQLHLPVTVAPPPGFSLQRKGA